jgi:colanic acid biosynthesis protein WcaH
VYENTKASGFLSAEEYKKILELTPVATVDFVIVHEGAFLLGKRKNKPAEGQWWVPGGRIMKGEKQLVALKRKLKEETGMSPASVKFVGVFDAIFPDSAFGPSTHSITNLYLVKPKSIKPLGLDSQHNEFGWFKKIDSKWHPYLKEQLRAAGFK